MQMVNRKLSVEAEEKVDNSVLYVISAEKNYKCSRGHTWKESGNGLILRFEQGDWSKDVKACMRCLSELLENYVSVVEVIETEKQEEAK